MITPNFCSRHIPYEQLYKQNYEATKLPKRMEKLFYNLGTNNSSEIATAILAGFKMIFIPMATAQDKKATPEQKRYTMARDIILEGLALCGYIGITQVVKDKGSAPLCVRYYAQKAKLVEKGKIAGVSKNILSSQELEMLKNVDGKLLKEVGMHSINPKKKVSTEAVKYVNKLEAIVDKLSKNWPEHSKKFSNPSGFRQKIYDAFDSAAKIVSPKKLFKDTRINLSQMSVWILALVVIPMACNAVMPQIMKCFEKITGKKDVNKTDNIITPEISQVNSSSSISLLKNIKSNNKGVA